MPRVSKRVAAARLNSSRQKKNSSGQFVLPNAIFLSSYRERCLKEYQLFIEGNSAVDVGHDMNHVIKVERLSSQALQQYIDGDRDDYQCWLDVHSQKSLDMPFDVTVRLEIAGLLHEYGDHKLSVDRIKTRDEILGDVIDRIASDYSKYTEEFRNDVIRMIDLCSASKWGDIVPENTKLYQLIPRWSDRQEATGAIGLARCLIYNYSKRYNIIE
jgi:HD superfamily phosphodiesterase